MLKFAALIVFGGCLAAAAPVSAADDVPEQAATSCAAAAPGQQASVALSEKGDKALSALVQRCVGGSQPACQSIADIMEVVGPRLIPNETVKKMAMARTAPLATVVVEGRRLNIVFE